MKYLALFVLIVVVLAAWAGVTGTDTGWWPGSHAGQFQGMHHGMHGMMGRPREAVPVDAPAALDQYACSSCHALHDGGVGPAFAWIAWRYQGQPGAQDAVASFITQGGQGGPWGGVMPNLAVPPAQARELAQWILALPPEVPPDPQRFRPQ
ncbi:c-type cytochrome [Pseudoxanthomonas spadix]|uniref:c-type cytochrome n=1 Tax=Pseudoxanthomonas spadix TaxID=415229 RepID=UPI001B339E7C|nr:c-type cytochrome [Pseudoxanthomonas spadix]MBP3973384.1 hypothetical protein [Pseudoxanthomonas spadix]